MYKKIKIIFLYIFIVTNIYSQKSIPGYMGKRGSVGYSLDFFVSYMEARPHAQKSLGINFTHCLNIDYTIKNRTNFCFSEQFFKTGIENNGTNTLPGHAIYTAKSGQPLAVVTGYNTS